MRAEVKEEGLKEKKFNRSWSSPPTAAGNRGGIAGKESGRINGVS